MRRLTIAVSILFCSCNHNSPEYKNIEHLKGVQEGMTMEQVYNVMGKPDTILTWAEDGAEFRLSYRTPFGWSDQIYIFMGKTDSLVKRINDGS